VNIAAYSREEAQQRLDSGDPWILNVWREPKIFLTGSEDLLPQPSAGISGRQPVEPGAAFS
jgi:hypothetical protein